MVRTFLKVYMELGSTFLFLQEQIKDIIIGPEEHDRDDGDCMAQIQELQELLAEQAAGSRSPPTGEVHQQLAASRVEFDEIMAFDLEAQLASYDGV
jgi:hypothetical protein